MSVYYIHMDSDFASMPTEIGQSAVAEVKQMDWVKVALIVVVLALLGFNVFTYLSEITEWFKNTFGPLFRGTVGTAADVVGDTVSKTVETAAEGTQAVVGEVAKGTTSGIGQLQQALGGDKVQNRIDGQTIDFDFGKAESQFVMNQDQDEADTSFLSKKTKGHGNPGYCYIGEDRGVRSCLYVGNGDMCMSGQIYPTMDVCINPNLRP